LKTLHLRLRVYHYVHIDKLGSIHMQRENICITAVCHATAWYAKTRYWWSAEALEVANSHSESLLIEIGKHLTGKS